MRTVQVDFIEIDDDKQTLGNRAMTTFTITVQDAEVKALLQRLQGRVSNMRPVLQNLGEGIVDRTKRRFDTSTSPDGTPWAAYPLDGATINMLTQRIGGSKSNRKKDGSLNSRGAKQLGNKKLLIDAGDLRRQIVQVATSNSLTVSSTMKYAAIHQFGGTTGAGSWIPGKKIPARPFLPLKKDGSLYPQEQAEILAALNDYLAADL